MTYKILVMISRLSNEKGESITSQSHVIEFENEANADSAYIKLQEAGEDRYHRVFAVKLYFNV